MIRIYRNNEEGTAIVEHVSRGRLPKRSPMRGWHVPAGGVCAVSYKQDMAAWQREWCERYRQVVEREHVGRLVKPGAPPRPRRQRNPAVEEVTPEKQAVIDSILPEQGSRARVV